MRNHYLNSDEWETTVVVWNKLVSIWVSFTSQELISCTMHQTLADWSKKNHATIMWPQNNRNAMNRFPGKTPWCSTSLTSSFFWECYAMVSEQSLTSFLTSCSFKESHHRMRPWVCVSFLRIKTVIFYFSAVFLFHNRLFNKFLWTKTVFHFSEFFLFHNQLLSWHNSIKLNTFWRRHSFLI